MKFAVHIIICLAVTCIASCITRTEETITVENVNMEAIVDDSSEMKVPVPPEPDQSQPVIVLRLNYNAISCACAQWSESKYNKKRGEREYIFLERGDNNLLNADSLWTGDNLPLQVEVTGTFRQGKGLPENYHPAKGTPEPARVFIYKKIRVLQNGEPGK